MLPYSVLVSAIVGGYLAHASPLGPSDPQQPLQKSSFCHSIKSYTALGDSFAAGFGALERLPYCNDANSSISDPKCTPETCQRNTGSYAYRFAHEFNISKFQYAACNGEGTDEVLDRQVNNTDVRVFGDPDLVTLNVGGNDGDVFAEVVKACVYLYNSEEECNKAISKSEKQLKGFPARIRLLTEAIASKIDKGTRVFVMSYAHFFGDPKKTCPFPFDNLSKKQKTRMNRVTQNLNTVLKTAAEEAGFDFANVDPKFEGHRYCDVPDNKGKDEWFQWEINDLFWPSPAHPTFEGQTAFLATLKDVLGCT